MMLTPSAGYDGWSVVPGPFSVLSTHSHAVTIEVGAARVTGTYLEHIQFSAGQSHEKCIIVVCGITAAAIENPIGSASEPIFGDANHKNPVACGLVAQMPS
jgi:hypothetical protein